ncbi:MAG: hypothetical protein M1828_005999 [Chrysothrix sp. TS-e1954]|nr:MAG: hypothetical protein M1828_005999 [Chrysothrix sp. TS-e1954]
MAPTFLELPGEIRAKIYCFTLQPEREIWIGPRAHRDGIKVINGDTGAGIALACKKTYTESIDLLYDRTFVFVQTVHPWLIRFDEVLSTILTFFRQLSEEMRHSVTKISLVFDNYSTIIDHGDHTKIEVVDMWKYLLSETRLEEITISLVNATSVLGVREELDHLRAKVWHSSHKQEVRESPLGLLRLVCHNCDRPVLELIMDTLRPLSKQPAVGTTSLRKVRYYLPARCFTSTQDGVVRSERGEHNDPPEGDSCKHKWDEHEWQPWVKVYGMLDEDETDWQQRIELPLASVEEAAATTEQVTSLEVTLGQGFMDVQAFGIKNPIQKSTSA